MIIHLPVLYFNRFTVRVCDRLTVRHVSVRLVGSMTTRDQPRPSKMEKLINDVFSDRLSPHQKIAMRKALQGKSKRPHYRQVSQT